MTFEKLPEAIEAPRMKVRDMGREIREVEKLFVEKNADARDAKVDVARSIVDRISSMNESKSGNTQSTNVSHSIGSLAGQIQDDQQKIQSAETLQ